MAMGQDQLRSPVGFSPRPSRAAFQSWEVGNQTGAGMVGQAGRILAALTAGPAGLLLARRRRRRLVKRVEGERVPKVRVGVAGLGVRQRLVGRWEVRGLEI